MDPKQLRDIIKEELEPIKKTQQDHSEKLENYSEKLDAVTAELHQVHQLADAIKEHLGLPKEPYFGKQP